MPNSWARVASLLSPVGSGWAHHAGTSPLAAGIVMTTRRPVGLQEHDQAHALEIQLRRGRLERGLRAEGQLHFALEGTGQGGARLFGADLAGSQHVVGELRKGLGHGIVAGRDLLLRGVLLYWSAVLAVNFT